MPRLLRVAACVLVCALGLGSSAQASAAETTGGCAILAWPLEVERGWLGAGNLESLQSGAVQPAPPQKAFAVELGHAAAVALPTPPTGKPHGEAKDTYAGFVALADVAEPGLYQVTLSGPGWIDVIQGGLALAAQAHTSSADCPNVRKSVRFQLAKGRTLLEFSSVPSAALSFAIRRAD